MRTATITRSSISLAGGELVYLRWTVASVLLLLGACNSLLAWNIETCTGNAADSLNGGLLTLPLYVLGWVVIPKRLNGGFAVVVAIPVLINALVLFWTARLAIGWNACRVITGAPFEPTGDELWFVSLWTLVCLAFWLGMTLTIKVSGWNKEDPVEQV